MAEKTVRMFTRLGDTEIPLGECHPARARVLVKGEVAAWEEGRLRMYIKPVYLALLENQKHALTLPDEKLNEDQREARLRWFRSLIPRMTEVVVPADQDPRKNLEHITSQAGLEYHPPSPKVPQDPHPDDPEITETGRSQVFQVLPNMEIPDIFARAFGSPQQVIPWTRTPEQVAVYEATLKQMIQRQVQENRVIPVTFGLKARQDPFLVLDVPGDIVGFDAEWQEEVQAASDGTKQEAISTSHHALFDVDSEYTKFKERNSQT